MVQGGRQEDNRTAMAWSACRCWGSFRRGGCLKSGGIQGTTQQGRCGSSARSPARQDMLLLAEGAQPGFTGGDPVEAVASAVGRRPRSWLR